MRIQVVSVSKPEKVTTQKGFYQKLTVDYRDFGADDPEEIRQKSLVSFSNPGVFKALQNAENGDVFELSLQKEVKDGNTFWQWTSATKEEQVPTEKKTRKVTTKDNGEVVEAKQPVKVTGSTYETREERGSKQTIIVRQSSLANAIQLSLELTPGATSESVLREAEAIEAWVLRGFNAKTNLIEQ